MRTSPQLIKRVGRILDVWLPWKIAYDELPGLVVGIALRGRLLYARGFGRASIRPRRPMTPRTLFRVASISKMFTAVACLQLVAARKLKLTDLVIKHVPWLAAGGPAARRLRVDHLLSHEGGIFRDGRGAHWVTDRFPKATGLRRQWSREAHIFPASRRFKYSNVGYALLGLVIEAASGEPYAAYIRHHILKPLGLQNTLADYHPSLRSRLALGYGRIIPGRQRDVFPHRVPTHVYAPAAGAVTDVRDLTRFMAALAPNQTRLLPRKWIRAMYKPRRRTSRAKEWYGYGLEIVQQEDGRLVGHGGGFSGFITKVNLDPREDLVVATLSNALGSNALALNQSIFLIIDKLLRHRRELLGPDQPRVRQYTGLYRDRWSDTVLVPMGGVLLTFSPLPNHPLKELAYLKPTDRRDRFTIHDENAFGSPGETATFKRNRRGRVIGLRWGAHPSRRIADRSR